MTTLPVSIAGDLHQDRQLWNTYLFWARSVLDPSTHRKKLLISPTSARVPRATSRHLQAILFVAFVLEYRIKRIYDVLGLGYRKRDTLGALLQNFRRRLETAMRLDDKGPIRLPAEWTTIENKLQRVKDLRNDIAHANYRSVTKILPKDARRSRVIARDSFNALIDAIRITNQALGYEHRSAKQAKHDFSKLKIR